MKMLKVQKPETPCAAGFLPRKNLYYSVKHAVVLFFNLHFLLSSCSSCQALWQNRCKPQHKTSNSVTRWITQPLGHSFSVLFLNHVF